MVSKWKITAEWGHRFPSFAEKLEADTEKQIKAVVQTSTGVLTWKRLTPRKAHGEALIIDAVTSLGAVNLP